MTDIYLCDGEFYCDDCCQNGDEAIPRCQLEGDSPYNCAECGQPLFNPLTADGIQYVLAMGEEEMVQVQHTIPLKGTGEETLTYYRGCQHKAIVLDWLHDMQMNYCLDAECAERLERILDVLDT